MSGDEVPDEVAEVAFGKGDEGESLEDLISQVDIAFVIDTTGSMQPFLNEAKKHAREDANRIAEGGDLNVRYAVVQYRDHPPEDTLLTEVFGFADDARFQEVLERLVASGGGDRPEAVYDGLVDAALQLQWRPQADKLMFLIGDSPPHGVAGSLGDTWPDGCPCKATPNGVVEALRGKGIRLHAFSIAGNKDTSESFRELAEGTEGTFAEGEFEEVVVSTAATMGHTSDIIGASRAYSSYVSAHPTASAADTAGALGWTADMVAGAKTYLAGRGIDPREKPAKKEKKPADED